MGLIGMIVIGGIIGAIARFVIPGKTSVPGGVLGTIVIGIIGGLIGGYIWRALFNTNGDGVEWIGSIIATVLLLLGFKALTSRSAAV